MNDFAITVSVVLFLFGWYGLILLIGHLLTPQGSLRFVWCPETKSFSLVEAESTFGTKKTAYVKHCLLWPELRGCHGRCLK